MPSSRLDPFAHATPLRSPRADFALRPAARRCRVRVHPSRDRRERRHRARTEQASARAGPARRAACASSACPPTRRTASTCATPGPEELVGLINALTTNVTSFFRENHHFEALASYMLPEAMKRNAGVAPHSHLVGRLLDGRGSRTASRWPPRTSCRPRALGFQDSRDRHRQRRDRVRAAGRVSARSRRARAAGAFAQLLSEGHRRAGRARRSSRRAALAR